jgi:hypothetical protein
MSAGGGRPKAGAGGRSAVVDLRKLAGHEDHADCLPVAPSGLCRVRPSLDEANAGLISPTAGATERHDHAKYTEVLRAQPVTSTSRR